MASIFSSQWIRGDCDGGENGGETHISPPTCKGGGNVSGRVGEWGAVVDDSTPKSEHSEAKAIPKRTSERRRVGPKRASERRRASKARPKRESESRRANTTSGRGGKHPVKAVGQTEVGLGWKGAPGEGGRSEVGVGLG